ncbi:hypothetical protein JCM3774_004238 [Rhodotorula dairenensis]
MTSPSLSPSQLQAVQAYSSTGTRTASTLAGEHSPLPLRFVLLRPLSAALSSPAALVSAALPLRRLVPSPPAAPAAAEQDAEPFISLARILLACSITPIEALLRFPHVGDAYDPTLGGLAPFHDLWVPLQLARQVVDELGRLDELEALLDWESRRAWTVEDREEDALLHNWRIPADCLSSGDYSTQAMLATPFDRIVLLPAGNQLRTLLPPLDEIPQFGQPRTRGPDLGGESEYDHLWSKVVEWSVIEYERWNQRPRYEFTSTGTPLPSMCNSPSGNAAAHLSVGEDREESANGVDGSLEITSAGDSDLTPLFLFTTLTTLLRLGDLLPTTPAASSTSSDTLSHLPTVPALHRAALLAPSSQPLSDRSTTMLSARLYLLDAVSRLVVQQYEQHQLAALSAVRTRQQIREATLAAERNKFGSLESRMSKLEQRMDDDARRNSDRASRDRLMRDRVRALEDEVDRLSLGARRAQIAEANTALGRVGAIGVDWRYAAAAAFVLGVAVGTAFATAGGLPRQDLGLS